MSRDFTDWNECLFHSVRRKESGPNGSRGNWSPQHPKPGSAMWLSNKRHEEQRKEEEKQKRLEETNKRIKAAKAKFSTSPDMIYGKPGLTMMRKGQVGTYEKDQAFLRKKAAEGKIKKEPTEKEKFERRKNQWKNSINVTTHVKPKPTFGKPRR